MEANHKRRAKSTVCSDQRAQQQTQQIAVSLWKLARFNRIETWQGEREKETKTTRHGLRGVREVTYLRIVIAQDIPS